MRSGRTFCDGSLAHARFADEHRVVLGAARQDLDAAPDLVVAADDRIELALARSRRQVARVPVEGLVLALRVLRRCARCSHGGPSAVSGSLTRSRAAQSHQSVTERVPQDFRVFTHW